MWFPVGVFPHHSTQTPQLPFLSFLPLAAGSPPSTNIVETLVMDKQEARVPKSNANVKNNK